MSKVALSFKILDILSDGNLHKIKEISDKIEISQSAVRWYVDELLIAGFHIESIRGRKGGYILKGRKFY